MTSLTKAKSWFEARLRGERLSEHIICDWCGEPANADDFCEPAGAVICPRCLEDLANATTHEPRAEVGLVGGGA